MNNKGIKNWIHRHEKIHYILRCLCHFNDKSFVKDFNNPSERNAKLFFLKTVSNGEKHQGKIIYKIEGWSSGFFSEFLYTLLDMWYADSMGMYPVVVWGEKCAYYEENGVNGVYNVWEYYFLQYMDLQISDYDSGYRVANSRKRVAIDAFGVKNMYRLTENCAVELSQIYKKYIRLKPEIEGFIHESIKSLLGEVKKTLGVQIRMGGMLGNYNGHPIVPTLDEYVIEIRKIFNKSYDQIFLATDDKRALERMKNEFGNKVIYYSDITRVDGVFSTYCIQTTDEFHYYKCGLEVLLDMYTLARCEGLVAGISNVNLIAQIVKISWDRSYEDFVLVDKGININNKKAPTAKEEQIIS